MVAGRCDRTFAWEAAPFYELLIELLSKKLHQRQLIALRVFHSGLSRKS